MSAQREWSAASIAGVAGAILCMLHLNPGDGESRVLLIVRAAIVFLALAVIAVVFLVMPRKPLLLSGGALLVTVASLAYVFDLFRSSTGLRASEALGIPAAIAAITQTVAVAIAAFASRKTETAERSSE